jgi:hypothetical protein
VLQDRTGRSFAKGKKTEFLTYRGHIAESYESHIMKNQESKNMSIKSTLY